MVSVPESLTFLRVSGAGGAVAHAEPATSTASKRNTAERVIALSFCRAGGAARRWSVVSSAGVAGNSAAIIHEASPRAGSGPTRRSTPGARAATLFSGGAATRRTGASIHAQGGPAASRRERLEPREPVHRLDRRRPVRRRPAGSPGRRRPLEVARLRLRSGLLLGVEAGHPHIVDRPRRDGPDVDSGGALVAAQRAPLRRAAGPRQGGDGRPLRRGPGQDLAPELRHPAARPRAERCALSRQRSAVPEPLAERAPP